jgi:tetratricopeptide (TPR) repeat protein
MALESFFTRWRKAVRPLPRGTPSPAFLAQKRKQRKLIQRTAGILVLLGVGWSVYSYARSAPDRARAEGALGLAKMGPGTYDQAIRHFDRATQIWPEYAEAYLNRGVAEHNLQRPAPALVDLDKALDLDPNLTRAYDERGQIYLEDGDPRKAIEELSQSIRLNATLEGYSQRGVAYEKVGEHQKAIADFDAAIAARRESPYIYRARAAAKRNLGDQPGAAADDDKARRIETGHAAEGDVLLTP